jgi:hypothetical protein
MRVNGVRSLAVSCWQRHHEAILSADPWSDDVPVPAAWSAPSAAELGRWRQFGKL